MHLFVNALMCMLIQFEKLIMAIWPPVNNKDVARGGSSIVIFEERSIWNNMLGTNIVWYYSNSLEHFDGQSITLALGRTLASNLYSLYCPVECLCWQSLFVWMSQNSQSLQEGNKPSSGSCFLAVIWYLFRLCISVIGRIKYAASFWWFELIIKLVILNIFSVQIILLLHEINNHI